MALDYFQLDHAEPMAISPEGHREYRVTYTARTNSVSDTHLTVYTSGSCPVQYISTHPDDVFAIAKTVDIGRKGKLIHTTAVQLWSVDVLFSGDIDTEDIDPDPLNRPALVDVVTERTPTGQIKDRFGDYMRTSAGSIMVAERTRPLEVITVRHNVAATGFGSAARYPSFMSTMLDRVNDSVFTIKGFACGVHSLKVMSFYVPNEKWSSGVWYFPFTTTLLYDNLTHDWKPPDQDWHELEYYLTDGTPIAKTVADPTAEAGYDATKTKRVRILTDSGEYAAEKTFLDEYGRALQNPAEADIRIWTKEVSNEGLFDTIFGADFI